MANMLTLKELVKFLHRNEYQDIQIHLRSIHHIVGGESQCLITNGLILIDQQDRVRTLIDPTSQYALAAAYAMGRSMDDEIIAAVSGNAFGGETGSTTIALPSAQKITESGTAGLTIAKLRSAKEIMDAASVDPSIPRTIVVSPKQITDLLGTTEVTSSDLTQLKLWQMEKFQVFLVLTL